MSNRRKWAGLGVLSLALAIIIIDTTLITVSLRTIVGDLNTTVQNLQWVITGYALVLSAFTITGGRMGDLFGRKRMFMIGAITFAIGSLVAATAAGYTELLLGASVIEGLGAAMMMPATAALILSTFQGRERAIAFGVWGGVAGAAAAFGPLVGGYLTTYYSWRYGYGINIVIVAILLAFSWLVVDSKENLKRPTIDFLGIFLSAVGLAAIVYGIVQSSTDGWFKAKQPAHFFNHPINLGDYSIVPFMITFGVLFLLMFLMWEAIVQYRRKTPLVNLNMFRNGPFVAGLTTMLIIAMGQFGTIFTLPIFFQVVRGLDAFHTGLAFLPFSLTTLLVAPISGALGSRKIPPKNLVVVGLLIDALGLLLLHNAISADATVKSLIFPLVVFGIGFGMAFAQLNNITLSAAGVQEAGEASGLNNTFRQLGATLGNAVLGSVLIASLTTNFTNGIYNSQVLPDPFKTQLAGGVSAQVQSLGQSGTAGANLLPPAAQNELLRIRDDATAKSVRHAISYGVVIVLIGALASLRLPSGIPEVPQGAPRPAQGAMRRREPVVI